MKEIVPKGVKACIQSARSALDDSDSLPGAFKYNASRYFLLILSWELYERAESELDSWVWKRPQEKKIFKDHATKLSKAPAIQYIVIQNGKAVETEYSTPKEISELRQWAQFGRNGQSRVELFWRGWHFDTFRNSLIGNLELLEATVEVMESLD